MRHTVAIPKLLVAGALTGGLIVIAAILTKTHEPSGQVRQETDRPTGFAETTPDSLAGRSLMPGNRNPDGQDERPRDAHTELPLHRRSGGTFGSPWDGPLPHGPLHEHYHEALRSAENGDEKAALLLHQILDSCDSVAVEDQDFQARLDFFQQTGYWVMGLGEDMYPLELPINDNVVQHELRQFEACREVPRDAQAAYEWLERAAYMGHPRAQVHFYTNVPAEAVADKVGAAEHEAKALMFLHEAANSGVVRAVELLGFLYANSNDLVIERDSVQGFAYYWAAVKYGSRQKDQLDKIAEQLSPASIEEGKRLGEKIYLDCCVNPGTDGLR